MVYNVITHVSMYLCTLVYATKTAVEELIENANLYEPIIFFDKSFYPYILAVVDYIYSIAGFNRICAKRLWTLCWIKFYI